MIARVQIALEIQDLVILGTVVEGAMEAVAVEARKRQKNTEDSFVLSSEHLTFSFFIGLSEADSLGSDILKTRNSIRIIV